MERMATAGWIQQFAHSAGAEAAFQPTQKGEESLRALKDLLSQLGEFGDPFELYSIYLITQSIPPDA